jgi:hypothetical protein
LLPLAPVAKLSWTRLSHELSRFMLACWLYNK